VLKTPEDVGATESLAAKLFKIAEMGKIGRIKVVK
jgi:hypothetical protein